jgi:hypothetical protein
MNYKEYSRLRSIAHKRIERASKEGLTEYVRLPTVKEVRASGSPERYLQAVQDFLNQPSTVSQLRKTGTTPTLNLPQTPIPPQQRQSDAERLARRREQNRRSKARRAIKKSAPNEKIATRQVGYLKALETVASQWREAGDDLGNWLGVMTPKQSKSFVDYMEYRFAQGDYNSRYTIDTFIRDFGELHRAGYNLEDIKQDFGEFLAEMKKLNKGKRRTNKHGMTINEFDQAWKMFVEGMIRKNR